MTPGPVLPPPLANVESTRPSGLKRAMREGGVGAVHEVVNRVHRSRRKRCVPRRRGDGPVAEAGVVAVGCEVAGGDDAGAVAAAAAEVRVEVAVGVEAERR